MYVCIDVYIMFACVYMYVYIVYVMYAYMYIYRDPGQHKD